MIKSVELTGYRGFQKFKIEGLGRVNLFVGKNNSGKTSILEALLLLAFNSDPTILWRVPNRRGEQLPTEMTQGRVQNELDISHLFYGHKISPGAQFSIATTNQLPSRSIIYKVEEVKQEESPVLFSQMTAIGEDALPARLALKILSSSATIPPIPFNKQMAIRPEMFAPLSNLARTGKGDSVAPQFVATESMTVQELLQQWNNIVLTPDEERVTQALRYLDGTIQRIAATQTQAFYGAPQTRGGFMVKTSGFEDRIPIGSFGDGIWRMLSLAVAISRAKDNILLVDEIDTGLHYTVMTDMWKLIDNAAKAFNVQVFATTHSYDCVHSLATICREVEDSESAITIHRVEAEHQQSIRFTEKQIKIAAEREIEIR
jgi:predicted ATPase